MTSTPKSGITRKRQKSSAKPKVWNQTARIRSALRQVWRWSPMRAEAIKAARVSRGRYRCAVCKNEYGPKEIRVDHLEAVSHNWNGDWAIYVERLFRPSSALQICCQQCHDIKTKQEREEKKRARSNQPKGD